MLMVRSWVTVYIKNTTCYLSFLTSIDPLTIGSDFTPASSQRANITHVNHRLSKGLEERGLVGGEVVDNGDCGGAVGGEELLVGLEKALIAEKVLEVVVVEGVWGRRVEVVQSVAASILRTVLLQCRQIGCVQRGIRATRAAQVEQSLVEKSTLRTAKSVCTFTLKNKTIS